MTIEELKKIGIALPILLSIILLAVISVIVVVSFQEVKETTDTISMINETSSPVSPNKFAANSLVLNSVTNPRGNFLSVDNSSIILVNDTNTSINSNNYYPFPNGSIILNAGAFEALGSAYVNATYRYTVEASSYYYNITQTGGNTIQNITKQMPLLGTIMILLVIASLALGVFAFFGRKKKPL